jgi:hypothetical protein
MATKEFTPDTEKVSIEDQYKKGAGTPPPPVSDMNIPTQTPMSKEQVDAFLDETLPLMRKQAEYDKLLLEQLENNALLNRRPLSAIPGLLGLELKVRELQALGFLTQHKQGHEEYLKNTQEKEEALKTENK